MNQSGFHWVLAAILCAVSSAAAADELLPAYERGGAGPFDSLAGKAAWVTDHPAGDGEPKRSCASCHGADLSRAGRHLRTGKPIQPLAVSVDPTRLTDPAKVEKWLQRNCRWTLGRECTPQEKGDFIVFIRSQ